MEVAVDELCVNLGFQIINVLVLGDCDRSQSVSALNEKTKSVVDHQRVDRGEGGRSQ